VQALKYLPEFIRPSGTTKKWICSERPKVCYLLSTDAERIGWNLVTFRVVYCARFTGANNPMWTESAPDRLRLFCVCLFVGWLCQYKTRKGKSTGRAPWRLLPPGN
jgi:hypothetical protein